MLHFGWRKRVVLAILDVLLIIIRRAIIMILIRLGHDLILMTGLFFFLKTVLPLQNP